MHVGITHALPYSMQQSADHLQYVHSNNCQWLYALLGIRSGELAPKSLSAPLLTTLNTLTQQGVTHALACSLQNTSHKVPPCGRALLAATQHMPKLLHTERDAKAVVLFAATKPLLARKTPHNQVAHHAPMQITFMIENSLQTVQSTAATQLLHTLDF